MLLSVKEYAEKYGITQQAVYQKIKQLTLQVVVKNKKKFIVLEDEKSFENKEKEEVEKVELNHLKELLKISEKQNEELRRDKEQLYRQLEQSNILQLKTLESLKQLEYSSEKINEELVKEKNKTWWDKIKKR